MTFWEKQGVQGGSTWCQVRHPAGEKLAFAQQVSGKVHVETWAGGCQSLNLKISQEQEIERKCAVVRFPPRIPFVTPALPGPGSDIRMKMGWNFWTKTEKSAVCFFSRMPGYVEEVGTSVTCGSCRLGVEGIGPYCMGGSLWFLMFLFVFVWAGPSYRATYWRAVLATASRCVEWCVEGKVPTAANLNIYRGK